MAGSSGEGRGASSGVMASEVEPSALGPDRRRRAVDRLVGARLHRGHRLLAQRPDPGQHRVPAKRARLIRDPLIHIGV